jgi:transcriptional regulator with XRE-family HTH domain
VRQARDLRQSDVAARARVSQKLVSDVELGRLEAVGIDKLRRIAAQLDVVVTVHAQWRGGQGDRLIDRAHAAMVEATIRTLTEFGWNVVPEFTFNHFGDRGSVDILAWHAGQRILLIIEVKATLNDLQDLLGSLSKKLRVVPDAVRRELGWDPAHVARIVVVAGTAANRSVVARHASTFDSSFPARSREVRSWLRHPEGAIAGIWFVATSAMSTGTSIVRSRVRRQGRNHA